MSESADLFRAIPSTDKSLDALRTALEDREDEESHAILTAPRILLREAVCAFWDGMRQKIRAGRVQSADELSTEACLPGLMHCVARAVSPALHRVINASGVIIHTNTGRSVLASEAAAALQLAAGSYTTLELDITTGGRGSRSALLSPLLRMLTGAEDALIVNNNAAGVLLVMDTFCRGREAVISRGELVEIGGSFRIPDVMRATGVQLKEVGTTNRTHAEDYETAISEATAAIVRVHTSNFRIVGFHTAVKTEELARIAREKNLLLINDLGSGSLMDFSEAGLSGEPTVQQAVAQGSDLVLFSGDKLLGGPQAGIIVGRRDLIARLRKNPLLRALRCDKLVYAALEATLRLYLDPARARESVPTIRAIFMTREELGRRAAMLAERIREKAGTACTISLREDSSRCGGGAFPEYPLPTVLCCVRPGAMHPDTLRRHLLDQRPVLIGRIEDDAFCLDVRTLRDEDFPVIARLLGRALTMGQTETCPETADSSAR